MTIKQSGTRKRFRAPVVFKGTHLLWYSELREVGSAKDVALLVLFGPFVLLGCSCRLRSSVNVLVPENAGRRGAAE